ncbi:MAG: ester cyclase [Anaerolineales bacterium]
MSSTQFHSPIYQIFDEAFNQGNLDIVDKLLAPDYSTHNAFGRVPNGPQGLKCLIAMLRNAFPDFRCTLEDEIQQGDKLAAHWTMRGTHTGLFMGNPPTGRAVEAQGVIFARTENDRIVEDWTLVDEMGILQQLGLIPPS